MSSYQANTTESLKESKETGIVEQSSISPSMASFSTAVQPTIERHPTPEIINPLDRPSSPEPQSDLHAPFADPESQGSELSMHDALETISFSLSSSRTPTIRDTNAEDDNISTISDWTDAFETQSRAESDLSSAEEFDSDSDSDVVSDAESEASWARVRSRGVGVH
jgi:hypothetical protein